MRKIILLAGPTASGKSALSLKWAGENNGEIVNGDSMQIYKELRILTACPSAQEEAKVPHHLYRTLKGDQACSAQDWKDMARKVLDDIWSRGKLPIVVGGTGLYFKTLVDGLSPVPEIDSEIRAKIRGQLTEEGSEILHQRLSEIDPIMASRLAPKDGQRTARALEVIISSGQSLAHWQEQPAEGGLEQEDNIEIQRNIMTIDRAVLYDRCNRRFMMMMQEDDGSSGALEEVRHLMTLGYQDNIGVMKSLGVAHLSAYLRGELTRIEAVTLAQTSTRQYAKRQMTWFRNQCSDWNRVFS